MGSGNFDEFLNSVKTELNEVKSRFKKKVETMTEIAPELDEYFFVDQKETGLYDRYGVPIKIGDTVKMVLEDGSVRCFKVCYKTVKRKIFCNPVFEEETAEVYITGVVFCWNGYNLFPRAGITGESDTEKMEIIEIVGH